MRQIENELGSAISHLIGAVLGVFALIALTAYSVQYASIYHVVSFVIFGVSLILLYTASTVYHFIDVKAKAKRIMKRVDHMMIFVLIAGTYTPICIVALSGPVGNTMLAVIWSVALMGILLKAFWIDAPRWLGTGMYIAMGWLAVFVLYPLRITLPVGGFFWLALGGILYTIGGVIYATKKPNFAGKWFGFHEIFHVFVLLGSACHFIVMAKYIMAMSL